jgi:hypothetical protein
MFFRKEIRIQKLEESVEELTGELNQLAEALGYERVSYATKEFDRDVLWYSGLRVDKAVLKYKWQKKEESPLVTGHWVKPDGMTLTELGFLTTASKMPESVKEELRNRGFLIKKSNHKGRKPGSKNKKK